LVTAIALSLGYLAGASLANQFTLPPQLVAFDKISQGFIEGLQAARFYSTNGTILVWLQNLRAVLLATLLGIFSFGILGLLVLMLPLAIIGYVAANVSLAGHSALTFLVALVLPHGIFELPAMLLAGAAILNLGATLTAPANGKTIGEAWLLALAKWAKIMLGVVLPLFLLAALVEVFITPQVAVWILGK
jgi:stage II sporulation protein M